MTNHNSNTHPGNGADPYAAEWQRSTALQQEFPSAESYAALKRAEEAGRVKVHRGSVTDRDHKGQAT